MNFNVVQYNAFARPYVVSHDGQLERMAQIPDALSRLNGGEVDAITLCEIDFQVDEDVPVTSLTDTQRPTRRMLDRFQQCGFGYHTRVLDDRTPYSLTNGGVIIVSKWPIIATRSVAYSVCDQTDCLAAKGIMYAAVRKTENGKAKTFHLFATHMQAWYSPAAIAVRVKQAEQLQRFADSLALPASDPVIVAGDLNTDLVLYPEEFDSLRRTFLAELPRLIGTQRYTSDPDSNLLVGRDGAADDCKSGYERSWLPKTDVQQPFGLVYTYDPAQANKGQAMNVPSTTAQGGPILPFFRQSATDPHIYIAPGGVYCPCCPHEWLDFVLYSSRHQQPATEPTLECVPIKASAPFRIPWSGLLQPWAHPALGTRMMLSDLSDHYPVIGKFSFEG
jgi:endonuclease/exonuclease/phosphatase family metal-dependent hydrolase